MSDLPDVRSILAYGVCKQCGVDCWLDVKSGKEPNLVEIHSEVKWETEYGEGANWIEVWKCPACGHVFEESNGYP